MCIFVKIQIRLVMKRIVYIIIMCFMAVAKLAAEDTQIHIFDPIVKSLKIAPINNMYFPHIYVLGSDDVLNVNFDYIDLDIQYFRYSD